MHVVKRVNSWFYQERFALQDLFQRVPITRGLLMLQASLGKCTFSTAQFLLLSFSLDKWFSNQNPSYT